MNSQLIREEIGAKQPAFTLTQRENGRTGARGPWTGKLTPQLRPAGAFSKGRLAPIAARAVVPEVGSRNHISKTRQLPLRLSKRSGPGELVTFFPPHPALSHRVAKEGQDDLPTLLVYES